MKLGNIGGYEASFEAHWRFQKGTKIPTTASPHHNRCKNPVLAPKRTAGTPKKTWMFFQILADGLGAAKKGFCVFFNFSVTVLAGRWGH